MRKYLFTILIVSFLGSCVSLEEERISLNEKGSIKGDSLEKALVNPDKGVHYVFVDTTDKELLIRYEEKVTGVNFIPTLTTRLSEEKLLFVPVVDTVLEVLVDTNFVDSLNLVEEQDVVEVVEPIVQEEIHQEVVEQIIEVDSVVTDSLVE